MTTSLSTRGRRTISTFSVPKKFTHCDRTLWVEDGYKKEKKERKKEKERKNERLNVLDGRYTDTLGQT